MGRRVRNDVVLTGQLLTWRRAAAHHTQALARPRPVTSEKLRAVIAARRARARSRRDGARPQTRKTADRRCCSA